jgi:hypothetical protein
MIGVSGTIPETLTVPAICRDCTTNLTVTYQLTSVDERNES